MTYDDFEEWIRVQKYLKQAKAREMELRKEIVKDMELHIGTNNVPFYDAQLKIVVSEKLSLDANSFDEIAVNLTQDEMDCIVHKPSLDKKKYDKLPSNNNLALNCVTRKRGTPSITVVF